MRAILINPVSKSITEIDLKRPNRSLQEFYSAIDASTVEIIRISEEIDLVIDEEGRLKPIKGAFKFFGVDDFWIAGKAVVIGERNGSFIALPENLSSFEMIVEWISPENTEALLTQQQNSINQGE